MENFSGRTAVITGGASGIGLALAHRCVIEGMQVVIADVNQTDLQRATDELQKRGGAVLGVHTDVSKQASVEVLLQAAVARFGPIHLLCNNAGVAAGRNAWDTSVADWEWTLGVNLWGVIFGLNLFVPHMLGHGEPSHVVNTASIAGLITPVSMTPYAVSKHAVVALTESLHQRLVARNAPIRAHVLCPGFAKTQIYNSERNRPGAVADISANPATAVAADKARRRIQDSVESGIEASEVADAVFAGLQDNRFYILTHPEMNELIELRHASIMRDAQALGSSR